MSYSAKRNKNTMHLAEYTILYFAKWITFLIFAAEYTTFSKQILNTYEHNNRKKNGN